MFLKGQFLVLPVSLALLAAGDQTWKDKPIAEWNDGDAKQVLTDSPWVKTATPTLAYLDKPEMDAVLQAPNRQTSEGMRDYALLLFLYNTGARADEAALDRVIGGVHYPTDIEAGKRLGEAIYAELRKNPAFQRDEKALEKYIVKKDDG